MATSQDPRREGQPGEPGGLGTPPGGEGGRGGQGGEGGRGATGATGSRGVRGRWRLSLFISALALVVALGANLSSYKITQDNIDKLHTQQDKACAAGTVNRMLISQNREQMRVLATAALVATRAQLVDDVKAGDRPSAVKGDLDFIKKFEDALNLPHVPKFICPYASR